MIALDCDLHSGLVYPCSDTCHKCSKAPRYTCPICLLTFIADADSLPEVLMVLTAQNLL